MTDVVLDPDPGIIIKSPYNPPRGMKFTRPVTWQQTTDGFSHVLSPHAHDTPAEKAFWLGTRDIDESYNIAVSAAGSLSHASIAFGRHSLDCRFTLCG